MSTLLPQTNNDYFIITADNPKGLDYEFAVNNMPKLMEVVAKIAIQGGANIKVNGDLVPQETLAKLTKAWSRS